MNKLVQHSENVILALCRTYEAFVRQSGFKGGCSDEVTEGDDRIKNCSCCCYLSTHLPAAKYIITVPPGEVAVSLNCKANKRAHHKHNSICLIDLTTHHHHYCHYHFAFLCSRRTYHFHYYRFSFLEAILPDPFCCHDS